MLQYAPVAGGEMKRIILCGSRLCNSVDISRTGVFLESPKALKVDAPYDLAVMGQPGRGIPTLQVRILRERDWTGIVGRTACKFPT
jgi:hypothetical protein